MKDTHNASDCDVAVLAPDPTHWGYLLGVDAASRLGQSECPFAAGTDAAAQFRLGLAAGQGFAASPQHSGPLVWPEALKSQQVRGVRLMDNIEPAKPFHSEVHEAHEANEPLDREPKGFRFEPLDLGHGIQKDDPGVEPPPANFELESQKMASHTEALAAMAIERILLGQRQSDLIADLLCGLAAMNHLVIAGVKVMRPGDFRTMEASSRLLLRSLRDLVSELEPKLAAN